MAFLYFLSEIGGVLTSIVFHPEEYGVGASCAGFGLIGFIAAYVITNWNYMNRTRKYQNAFLLGFALFWFLLNMGINFGPNYW